MNKGSIVQVFLDSNLRCGHTGLGAIAKKEGLRTEKLENGEYIVFVNSAKTMAKVYAAHQIIAHIHAPKGQPIDLRLIREIPKAFTGNGNFSYDDAVASMLSGKRILRTGSAKKVFPLVAAKKRKEHHENV